MNPFALALLGSSAISGGASLFGGLMNAQAQSQANAQNMLMNTGDWKATQIRQEASALGLSPLAVLGNTGSSIPFQAVTGMGDAVSQAGSVVGQNLTRAASAYTTAQDKAAALDLQNKQLDLQSKREDVIAKQMLNSSRAISMAQPATPPPVPPPAGTRDNPYPMQAWYRDEDGSLVSGLSRQFAGTQFGPTAYYTGLRSMFGLVRDNVNQLLAEGQAYGSQLGDRYFGGSQRGDIWRNLNNPPPMPDPYSNYGGG